MTTQILLSDNDERIETRIRLMEWVGVTAIDLWNDIDGNGTPDKYESRQKNPNSSENEYIDIGRGHDLVGKVVQWSWMPSRPTTSPDDEWIVEIDVRQNGVSLAGFPLTSRGPFPEGKKHGLFQVWLPVRGAD